MTLNSVGAWWRDNVAPSSDDFGTAGAGRVARSAGVGAGVGAVAGGTAAGVNAAMDEPYVDYVSETVPRGEAGPHPEALFGADHARLLEAVRSRSDDSGSAARSLQYLAHLKAVSPGTSNEVLSSLFQTVENHFPQDDQARTAMNLLAAAVEKRPGTSPYQALSGFLNQFHESGDFDGASKAFAGQYGLTQADLEETTLKMGIRHTTFMGRFGVAGAIGIGAGVGAVAGAGVGAVVGVLWNAIEREAPQG